MQVLADECPFSEVDKLLRALYEHTVFWYSGRMQTTEEIWIAACAHELQRRWRTVDPEQLEELSADLWRVEELRALSPAQAAKMWLRPVTGAMAA